MPLHPRTCSILYSVSCLLDALDGAAARHYEQSTQFGTVLDMVTDRCTTSCLLVFLSTAFPRWALVFQGLISLDLSSHYIHMYATLTMGGGQSHKKVSESRSKLLHLYYNNKVCESSTQSAPITLTNRRPFCSLSVHSTSSFSLLSTCSHSPRQPYHNHCCLQRTSPVNQRNLAARAIQPCPC